MDEVWMLDYLYAVFPHWGVFESEDEAWAWVKTHNAERLWPNFKPFSIQVNRNNSKVVDTTCPEHSYRNQR